MVFIQILKPILLLLLCYFFYLFVKISYPSGSVYSNGIFLLLYRQYFATSFRRAIPKESDEEQPCTVHIEVFQVLLHSRKYYLSIESDSLRYGLRLGKTKVSPKDILKVQLNLFLLRYRLIKLLIRSPQLGS